MNLSNLFGPVEAVEPQEFDSDRDAYCSCPATGKSRNVFVNIDNGRIGGVRCAVCAKPLLFGGLEDDFELISARELPLVLTVIDAWEHVNEYVTERYDAFKLTAPEGEVSV